MSPSVSLNSQRAISNYNLIAGNAAMYQQQQQEQTIPTAEQNQGGKPQIDLSDSKAFEPAWFKLNDIIKIDIYR